MRIQTTLCLMLASTAALHVRIARPLRSRVQCLSGGLDGLTVPQLKERLRDAGLPVSGRKDLLLQRLAARPARDGPAPGSAVTATVAIEFCKS